MGITAKMFRHNKLTSMSKLQTKALLDQIDNPGAIHTHKQIMVINTNNTTLSKEEKEIIEMLINKELEGGKDVAESRN